MRGAGRRGPLRAGGGGGSGSGGGGTGSGGGLHLPGFKASQLRGWAADISPARGKFQPLGTGPVGPRSWPRGCTTAGLQGTAPHRGSLSEPRCQPSPR